MKQKSKLIHYVLSLLTGAMVLTGAVALAHAADSAIPRVDTAFVLGTRVAVRF